MSEPIDTKRGRGGVSRTYAAAIFDFEGTLVDFQWRLDQLGVKELCPRAGMLEKINASLR